ncbi:hypothetical protein LOTGIDRAFT_120896, partial [Lottia gigantea]
ALAFAAAIGITFLVLGCALPQFNNWWPLFVLFFYFLAPIPTVVSRRLSSFDSASSALVELCIFITTGIVISSIGLPIVLAHVGTIQWGACGLVLAGNVVVFVTIMGYFAVFANDDFDYNNW